MHNHAALRNAAFRFAYSGAFPSGQLYVPPSRAKSIDGIAVAKPIAMKGVKAHPVVLEFYKQLGLDHWFSLWRLGFRILGSFASTACGVCSLYEAVLGQPGYYRFRQNSGPR